MKALDTNVLVRFLVKDDEAQAQAVYQILKRAEADGYQLWVSLVVVLEMLWVLESVYGIQKEGILESIEDLLLMPILKFEAQPAIRAFVVSARESNIGLPDLLIAHSATYSGCDVVLTFGKKAAKSLLFELHRNRMSETNKDTSELEFSDKYTDEHARQYFYKHTDGFWRSLSNRREIAIARKALRLAGDPQRILDLPSGTGRFWEMLAEAPGRTLYASDYNQSMLTVASQERPQTIARRFETFQASAFDIPKGDNFVDCIFCMRLLHHIGEAQDRLRMLREFHRVSGDSVVISLWVDGNFKAYKRAKMEQTRKRQKYQNRFVQPRKRVEAEMRAAGFRIAGHVDFLKYYAIWRIYILKKD